VLESNLEAAWSRRTLPSCFLAYRTVFSGESDSLHLWAFYPSAELNEEREVHRAKDISINAVALDLFIGNLLML
jgi:hypothetical protein